MSQDYNFTNNTGHWLGFRYLLNLLILLQEPWLCAPSSALASLFDSDPNPFLLSSQNLCFPSLIGFTLPCNLLPLPKVISFLFSGLCLHMVLNCHKSCCFSEPWVVLPMLRKMFGSQSRISPFWLVLCLKNGCFIYDRWTWKCKHWVSGYGNHGFSYGTKPPQSWVTLFCLAYLSYLQ